MADDDKAPDAPTPEENIADAEKQAVVRDGAADDSAVRNQSGPDAAAEHLPSAGHAEGEQQSAGNRVVPLSDTASATALGAYPPGHPNLTPTNRGAPGTAGSRIEFESAAAAANGDPLRPETGPSTALFTAPETPTGTMGRTPNAVVSRDADIENLRISASEFINKVRDFPHEIEGELGELVRWVRYRLES